MSAFEHPLFIKIGGGLLSAGVVALGSITFTTHNKVERHDVQIQVLMEMREDVRSANDKLSTVDANVRVLEERTRKSYAGSHPDTEPRP